MTLLTRLRRAAGMTKRWLAPPPDVAAWQRACREAERAPRFVAGRIQMGPYALGYSDLLTFCPQWYDIFVERSLAFESAKPAPRILDCGANIGLASLFFKRQHPGARITAFEADPVIAGLLASNLRDNGAGDVEVVSAAVWTSEGHVTFQAEGADSGTLTPFAAGLGGAAVRVPSTRLADRLAAEPIDLLKLDIEGAEGEVLADCAHHLGNVRAMLLEIHEFDPHMRRAPAITTLLTEAGFEYATTRITPIPQRQPAEPGAPFPHHARAWVEAVSAWRPAAS